jgi:lipopolysaccharide export LptBFGC system permease protein LptF
MHPVGYSVKNRFKFTILGGIIKMNRKLQRDEREEQNYNLALSKTLKYIFIAICILMLGSVFFDLINSTVSIVSVVLLALFLVISLVLLFNIYSHNAQKIVTKNDEEYTTYLNRLKLLLLIQAIVFGVLFYTLFNVIPRYINQKNISFNLIDLSSDLVFMLFIALLMYFVEKKRVIKD